MRDFKELKVWQKAHRLVLDIYAQSRAFPRRRALRAHCPPPQVGALDPLERGRGMRSRRPARAGSLPQTEYQLLLARDLGYLVPEAHRQLDAQVSEVRRMLASFMQKLTADG